MDVRSAIDDTMVLARRVWPVAQSQGDHFLSPNVSLKHLEEMYATIQSSPDFSYGKMCRWLGWMQASVDSWSVGTATLSEMKAINMAHAEDKAPANKVKKVLSSFQSRVLTWILKCFDDKIAYDRKERCYRFFEESCELCQSLGMTGEEALRLIWYVYSRDIGHPDQEMGGVMVTAAALANAYGMDMMECGETELRRVNNTETMVKIREKQKAKPRFLGS